jgi:hypothetical protein
MTKAERNRNKVSGTYCWRCGDALDESKAVWLVADSSGGRFYATEEAAGLDNMGGFAFGSACAKKQLRCLEAA